MRLFSRLFDGEENARRKAATAVGLEVGLLEECPVCREITDKQRDDRLGAADALADEWIARGDPRVTVFRRDTAALKEYLRKVRNRFDVLCTCEGR